MKKKLAIVFCLPTLTALGQDTTYLDNDWNKVESIKSATYFKILSPKQADRNRVTETVYFRSGKIKTQKDYSVFTERKLDGKSKEWFESGQIRKEIDYKDGKKNGELLTYWDNGKLKRAEKYENDKLIEGKCLTREGIETNHYDFEKRPVFPGGIDELRQYLGNAIKYPNKSIRNEEEGIVLVGFIVNKDGGISNIKIAQSVATELDQEAIRVVKKMPNWEPGMEDGEAVRVSFILPIQFKLE
jgi:periplasmic protein TonB